MQIWETLPPASSCRSPLGLLCGSRLGYPAHPLPGSAWLLWRGRGEWASHSSCFAVASSLSAYMGQISGNWHIVMKGEQKPQTEP